MDKTYCPHCREEIKPDAEWERWVDSMRHSDPKTSMEALEEFAAIMIEHGGDLSPNGNTFQGTDEGLVYTRGYFQSVIDKIRALD